MDNPVALNQKAKDKVFSLPAVAIHIMGILQEGFTNRMELLPEDIRNMANVFVLSSFSSGTLYDKKRALEVAGILSDDSLSLVLKTSFLTKSQWLKDIAFQQSFRLKMFSRDLEYGISDTITRIFMDGRLFSERQTVFAHLSRLQNSGNFISIANMLYNTIYVNLLLNFFMSFFLASLFPFDSPLAFVSLFAFFYISCAIYDIYIIRLFRATYVRPSFALMLPLLTAYFGSSIIILLPKLVYKHHDIGISQQIVLFVALLWFPSTIIVAKRGKSLIPLLSPFIIFYFLKDILLSKKIFIEIIIIGSFVAAIIGLFIFILKWGLETYPNIALVPIVGFIFLCFCYIAKNTFFAIKNILNDRSRRNLLLSITPAKIPASEFIRVLTSFHTSRIKLDYIRYVNKINILNGGHCEIDAICNFIYSLEQVKDSGYLIDSRIIDELWILVEQMHMVRNKECL